MKTALQRGMSLIELLVVMTIVGIMAVYAGAKWQGDLTLYPKADQLMNDIRRAQALAMRQEGNYTILRVSANSYRIQDASGTAVDPQPSVLTGVEIGAFSVTFNSRGDPGTANTDFQVSMEGESLTIRVVGNTGVAMRL